MLRLLLLCTCLVIIRRKTGTVKVCESREILSILVSIIFRLFMKYLDMVTAVAKKTSVICHCKITKLLRTLSLVDKCVQIRVCKHVCDILDSCIFQKLFLFIKAKEHFFLVYIASSKHSEGWENSQKLSKLSTASRVCITVSNSSSPPRVQMSLCKHGKKCSIA